MYNAVGRPNEITLEALHELIRLRPSDVVEALSASQRLDAELLSRFENTWEWMAVSCNPVCDWSLELVERFAERWYWDGMFGGGLSGNPGLPWSIELLDAFEDRWDWARVEREMEPGDRLLFGKYYDPDSTGVLSLSAYLPWSTELIERYEDRWDWELLATNVALPWTSSLIERFEKRWDWNRLTSNPALAWSSDLAFRFRDQLNWRVLLAERDIRWLPEHVEGVRQAAISYHCHDDVWLDPILPISADWVERHFAANPWECEECSASVTLPWSTGFLRRFHGHWNWSYLAANHALPWSEELIDAFVDDWDWEVLSGSGVLTAALRERYSSRLVTEPYVPAFLRLSRDLRTQADRPAPVPTRERASAERPISLPLLSRDEIIAIMERVRSSVG